MCKYNTMPPAGMTFVTLSFDLMTLTFDRSRTHHRHHAYQVREKYIGVCILEAKLKFCDVTYEPNDLDLVTSKFVEM